MFLSFHTLKIDTQIFRSNLVTQPASNQIFQIRVKRRRPVKVYVAFQYDDPANANAFGNPIARISGDQTQGKRVFDNIQLTILRCVLNSTVQYPEREYITSFTPGTYDYARVIDQGAVITYDNYKTIFPIFAIDLSEKEEYNVRPESALLEICLY